MGLGFFVPDMSTYRQRDDGQYRTDQAEKAHQEYLQGIRDRHERAEACALRVRSDKLLQELDGALDRSGCRTWVDRYLIIECIERLIEQGSTYSQAIRQQKERVG